VVRDKQIRGMKKTLKLLGGKKFCVITGAGISTDSGIPDYRGTGSAPKKPLNYDPFVRSEEYRKEFWIDGYRDWCDFSPAQPNDAHFAIADFENVGLCNGVITQNVDGLHFEAGSQIVAELHGNMYTSSCMHCKAQVSTATLVEAIELGNPSILTGEPDRENFWIPNCVYCTGPMKPDVTFFGENLPEDQFLYATEIAKEADAVIVAGTSLNVMTPLTFIQMAKSAGKPVIIVNRGRTMVDDMADVKVHSGLSDFFTDLFDELWEPVYI
jgi:NAD-dependent SIR2 family protein deacetylase